ncbi:hypothetical protein [Chitinophaga arvensicola]|uniref:Por secretion system C-terminal sorting domain-containing protein n=1 Tax=Chitinophaga arvensicola TaxID=29529 RepID=A0A1I0P5M5_9BACT|nr:hypothetical protein [Chitinophaga arvensicola]SEW09340.1 hypothetical protein SAMN04488122_0562 [Chitinophaga arvensicola]
MKHLRFVFLAPKVALLVFVTILFPILHAAAQTETFAYNVARLKGNPVATAPIEAFNVHITQLQKDQLLFQLSVDNPSNEKLTLYIKDNFNNTLHRETLPATLRFEARYNLASLEDGDYVFEIRSGKTKLAEKAIGIKTQTLVNRSVSVTE